MLFFEEIATNLDFPVVQLQKNNWDDYTYKVSFDVYYHHDHRSSTLLGAIKILDAFNSNTTLPKEFSHLPANYCSLGQSLEFYENVKRHFPSDFETFFEALNDIAFDEELAKKFENNAGYHSALFRFGSAQIAFNDAKRVLLYNIKVISDELFFSYRVKLDDATNFHYVDFDFNKIENLPYRINVLIGKNGTGKTSFLAGMVKSISGVKNKEGFSPHYPLFGKVIAISYSLFDNFPKPPESTIFNYKYIGLRASDEEIVSDSRLGEKLRDALRSILFNAREAQWFDIINEIIPLRNLGLNSKADLTSKWIEGISYEKAKRLSSGQSILLFILTELIANIQDKTLVLFDEPETHLHPSAVAQLMHGYYQILSLYESYSIISTHSPIVIQDVPARYISVFERDGNSPIIRKLAIESFGENISEITSIAFGTLDVKELYKDYLEKLYESELGSIESVNKVFYNKLSLNAQLYLAAFELKKQRDEEA